MTIFNLHGALTRMIESGNALLPVCIDISTFDRMPEAGGGVITGVQSAEILAHAMEDDGGIICKSDGTECLQTSLILKGNYGPNER